MRGTDTPSKRGARAHHLALLVLALVSSWLVLGRTHAQDAAQTAPSWGVDIHAFVSQGYILTTDNNYLARTEKRGSAEFSELGLNFTKSVTDQLRIGVQLFARDLGLDGNYRPQLDWYYLDYRFWDWLGLRAGRTKIPFGLYNEYNDIDAARVPILLPQSMYPSDNREILLAVTGGELYGNIQLGPVGQLEYRGYGGTFFMGTPPAPNDNVTVRGIRPRYLFGGRLTWFTPLEGLLLSASGQGVRFDTDLRFVPAATQALIAAGVLPAGFTGDVTVTLPVKLWVVSMEYTVQDFLLAAEYSRRLGSLEYEPAVLPTTRYPNERFYVMTSYRVLPWLTPGAYYSGYYIDKDHRKVDGTFQHDVAGTVRFDITQNWLVKLEGHLMRGTAALEGSPNGGVPLKDLTQKWGAFLVKTTAYF